MMTLDSVLLSVYLIPLLSILLLLFTPKLKWLGSVQIVANSLFLVFLKLS